MRECVDCGRHFSSRACPGCGWEPSIAQEKTAHVPPLDPEPQRSSVKCCLCRKPVLMSGWCDNCQEWPINITPVRWCERAHRVDADGYCSACAIIVATKLEPQAGCWWDTGVVGKLLSREENQRRLTNLILTPRPGLVKIAAAFRSRRSRKERKELEGQAGPDQVPF